jgi:hypothetical protein
VATSVEELVAALDNLPGRKFAVVDAAHFGDLQGELRQADLAFRPLYLDELGKDVEAAGPHLVPLTDRNAARRLHALAGEKPAVVWWAWPDQGAATDEAIYRHLRTINMAEIPAETGDDAADGVEPDAPTPHDHAHHDHVHHHHHDVPPPQPSERYELVVFRHADPRVMAMLLPLLDAGQVSRLFGEATGLVVGAPDEASAKSFPRPLDLPKKPRGWLKIGRERYEELNVVAQKRHENWIANYLRRVAPEVTRDLSAEQLGDMVRLAESNRRSLGIRTQRAAAKWAYLEMITAGRILQQDGVRRYMTDGEHAPDRKVDLMMRSLSSAYRHLGRQGS